MLEPGCEGDVVVLEPESLHLVHVFARGKRFVAGGKLAVEERFLEEGDRLITPDGKKRGG